MEQKQLNSEADWESWSREQYDRYRSIHMGGLKLKFSDSDKPNRFPCVVVFHDYYDPEEGTQFFHDFVYKFE